VKSKNFLIPAVLFFEKNLILKARKKQKKIGGEDRRIKN
jgi:hypothetical protein